jgi:hypothetical protein
MVIGRSEDRDNPRDPLVLRHHPDVWDPIRVTHLGQRSYGRITKAGHMTAFDQIHRAATSLQNGGRPHMGPDGTPGETCVELRSYLPLREYHTLSAFKFSPECEAVHRSPLPIGAILSIGPRLVGEGGPSPDHVSQTTSPGGA